VTHIPKAIASRELFAAASVISFIFYLLIS
jgi:hypothetical protein